MSSSIPSGVIVMWSGTVSNIPDGWLLCNGSNGTPDLRNRFIVGAGSTYSPGNTGGADTVVLSTSQMPPHNHTFTGSSHTHSTSSGGGSIGVTTGSSYGNGTDKLVGANSQSTSYYDRVISLGGSVTVNASYVSGTIGSAGSGGAHENRPPYYALCFIMKV